MSISDRQVVEVESRADLRAFIDLPYRLFKDDPNWAIPLRMQVRARLDLRKNPFFETAACRYLMVRRGKRCVARAAAFIDPRFDEHFGDRALLFGWFDCEDSSESMELLLSALESIASELGRTTLIGPLTFSVHEEAGVLIDGFTMPHRLMTPHNPGWYANLLEEQGFQKLQDLLAYPWTATQEVQRKLSRVAERVARQPEFEFSTLNMKDFDREIDDIFSIFNDAFSTTWGHIDLSRAEFQHMAEDLRRIGEPELTFIIRSAGIPAAFGVTVPDWNMAITAARGRLLPLGLFRMMMARRKIDAVRVMLLGVRPEFRGRGLEALIIQRTIEGAIRLGYAEAELSMVLESNTPMRRIIERVMGSEQIKRYRIYRKELEIQTGPD
ncbi:hypothetical protein ACFL6R_06025 [Gemmatimonadota bacterium]